MGNLTTLDNVKNYLRIKTENDDELLKRMISSCSKLIESWLNRTITAENYNEVFSGNEGVYHFCKNRPIISVGNVFINGHELSPSEFCADEECVYLNNNLFPHGIKNILVNYNAGYETVPEDIEQACIEMIAIKYKQIETIHQSSKSIGGETTSFIVKDMPDFVKVVLQQYKQVATI